MPNDVQYVPQELEPPEHGTSYENHKEITSIVLNDVTVKSASGFGYDCALAYECLDVWRNMGFKGAPTSPASFFREELRRQHNRGDITYHMTATYNHMFVKYLQGGWIETRKYGAVLGPIYHYDINKAYYWAGLQGLPSRITWYYPGAKDYVALFMLESFEKDLPNRMIPMMYPEKQPILVTSEDVEYFGLSGEIVGGVALHDFDVSPKPILDKLKQFLPYNAYKKLQSAYWGIWGSRKPLRCKHRYPDGRITEWTLHNYMQNLVWAALIIHRVVHKVYDKMDKGGIACFVDSILTPHRIPTGKEPGEWKHVSTFERGVYIKAPGCFDELGMHKRRPISSWYRHAGYGAPNL